MSPPAVMVEGTGGVTLATGLDDDHHAAATDWLSMDPDIGLAAAAHVSILPRDEAWTERSDFGHGFHDSRGGPIHGFTLAPTEWEARDSLPAVTVGPHAGSGLVAGHRPGDVATHVMRIPVQLVCGVDPGSASAGPSSVPASLEHIASFRTVSPLAAAWNERGLVPLAGSYRMVSNVRAARTHDVTFGLEETAESRRVARSIFAFWNAEVGPAPVSSATEVLSSSDAVSPGRPEVMEAGSAASAQLFAGTRDRVLQRLRALRADPEAEQPPWAERPSDGAFADALSFVSAWPSAALPMPDVGLADDGEVNFLWQGPELHVDLGFYGDGTFSCFARAPGGVRFAADDVAAELGLPPDLEAILKA